MRRRKEAPAVPALSLPIPSSCAGPSARTPQIYGPSAVSSGLSSPLSPLFATLTGHPQPAENKATLSPFPATLASRVKLKSFVCHSYKKHRGWGTPNVDSPTSFFSLSTESATISFHSTYASFVFMLLRTLLHDRNTYPSCFQTLPHSFDKTPGGGVPQPPSSPKSRLRLSIFDLRRPTSPTSHKSPVTSHHP